MENYIDKMADALVDVLKYSNSKVTWPELDDLKAGDGVLAEWFYPSVESANFSEITAILQYTQQEAVFEDLGELFLGIALVEMKHYANVRDAIIKLGGTLPRIYTNANVSIGQTPKEALILAVKAEMDTIEFYQSIEEKIISDTQTAKITKALLHKLISDETLHLHLISEQLWKVAGEEYKTKMIDSLSRIHLYVKKYL